MPKQNEKEKKAPATFSLKMDGVKAVLEVKGVIGWDTEADEICARVDEAKTAGCTELELHITSCGGCCYEGVAMGDALLNCGMHTTAVVRGLAASMGSYLVQCCDDRIMQPHATLMVHQPSGTVYGPVDEILARAQHMVSLRDAMFEQYGKRAGKTGAAMSAEHAVSKYYDAQQAKDAGLIDRIEGEEDSDEKNDPLPTPEPVASGMLPYEAAHMAMAMMAAEEKPEGEKKPDDEKKPEDKPAPAPPPTDEKKPEEKPADGTKDDKNKQATAQLTPEGLQAMVQKAVAEAIKDASAKAVAEAMASMGAPAASLPTPTGGSATAAPRPAKPTMQQFDRMSSVEKMEALEHYPELESEYMAYNP